MASFFSRISALTMMCLTVSTMLVSGAIVSAALYGGSSSLHSSNVAVPNIRGSFDYLTGENNANKLEQLTGLLLFFESKNYADHAQQLLYRSSLFYSWDFDVVSYHNFPVLFLHTTSLSRLRGLLAFVSGFDGLYKTLIDSRAVVVSRSNQLINIGPDPSTELTLEQVRSLIGSNELNDAGLTGKNVRVAVVDSGIDESHPDLQDKVLLHRSFVNADYGFESWETEGTDDNLGHGTGCAGIIAGSGAASDGMYQGIAPNVSLLDSKVFSGSGKTTGAAIIAGIDWAISNGADIVSMSFGGGGADPYFYGLISELVAVMAGLSQNVLMVASAGNEGPGFLSGSAPAVYPGVLSVGAYNMRAISDEPDDAPDLPAQYSSRGPAGDYTTYPDILAPSTIWAPLAAGSQFDGQFKNLDYGWKPGQDGDYWLFSGTSASTPVAVGVASILLQELRDTKNDTEFRDPWGIQLAMLRSAVYLQNITSNIQGAGLVNASAASTYISQHYEDGHVKGSMVLPAALPSDPFSLKFPGDLMTFNFTLLTDIASNLSVSHSPNLESFIQWSLDSLPTTITRGETYIGGSIYIPLNTSPGLYDGFINITLNNDQWIIPVNISVQLPSGRVFIDTIHSVDQFDTAVNGYYLFANVIREAGYAVDQFLEITPLSHIQKRPLLTSSFLSQYDILVIPDIEMPYSRSEIHAIQNFVEQGGGLICYGSFPPTFNQYAVNEVLSPFGIQYSGMELSSVYDIGIARNILNGYIDITEINASHPLTKNISRYYWQSGLELLLNETSALPLAWFNSARTKPVLALWDGTSLGKGRVVVYGNEVPIYNRPTSQRRFEGDFVQHHQLALNTIEWVSNNSLRLEVLPNSSRADLSTTSSILVAISVVDTNTLEGLNGTSLTATLTLPDNSNQVLSTTSIADGYWLTSFVPSIKGDYTVTVDWTDVTRTLQRNITVTLTADLPVVNELREHVSYDVSYEFTDDQWDMVHGSPGWSFMDRLGDNVTVAAQITNTTALANVTLVLGDIPEWMASNTYQNRTILRQSMYFNGTHWLAKWTPALSNSHGNQLYFIEMVDQSGQISWSTWREFIIFDYEPEISVANTYVDGKTLEDHFTQILRVSIGQQLSIELAGKDNETSLKDCRAYVMLFHYVNVYQQIPGVGILYDTAVQLNFSGNMFSGIFMVPDVSYMPPDGELVFRTRGKILALLFILVDMDGEVGVQGIFVQVQSSQLIGGLESMIIIAVFIGIVIIAFLLIYRRYGRAKTDSETRSSPAYPYPESPFSLCWLTLVLWMTSRRVR
ncbi:MAG: S8 family serine peptidase [Candidatus Ranarchaeia archaeon]